MKEDRIMVTDQRGREAAIRLDDYLAVLLGAKTLVQGWTPEGEFILFTPDLGVAVILLPPASEGESPHE